mgnify:CR=1 FL=1
MKKFKRGDTRDDGMVFSCYQRGKEYWTTPEQLEKRRLGIGGSDVAAICGLNPYKTALDVYFEKVLILFNI